MPPRPKRSRRAKVAWTAKLALALRLGRPPLAETPTDEEMRQAWRVYGDALVEQAPERAPWGFWAFDRRAPKDLRVQPGESLLLPLDDHLERGRRADLEARRKSWWADTYLNDTAAASGTN